MARSTHVKEPSKEELLAELARQEALLDDLARQRQEASARIVLLRQQVAAAEPSTEPAQPASATFGSPPVTLLRTRLSALVEGRAAGPD
jgi:hypothetical protein